ncbi:hypothetical protein Bpfe_031073 [Biomphalaria pfeifferi]|uniref:Uncharacterized protein n=1 Tax=Biomphalaria pfeifferi TaxID=112525 RepID=A0AAD8EUB2_BIOPF|nr:hypothetical protein Bpfe_031073 [Biomphalaria pfeifferi]
MVGLVPAVAATRLEVGEEHGVVHAMRLAPSWRWAMTMARLGEPNLVRVTTANVQEAALPGIHRSQLGSCGLCRRERQRQAITVCHFSRQVARGRPAGYSASSVSSMQSTSAGSSSTCPVTWTVSAVFPKEYRRNNSSRSRAETLTWPPDATKARAIAITNRMETSRVNA